MAATAAPSSPTPRANKNGLNTAPATTAAPAAPTPTPTPKKKGLNTAPAAAAPAAPTRTQSFHGSGLAILRSHPGTQGTLTCTFTHLSFSFPLKLITPRVSNWNASYARGQHGDDGGAAPRRAIAALYIVGYGGGLVSGDSVDLDVDVGSHCTLLLLTQGSTKVFKMRGGAAAVGTHVPPPPPTPTRQYFRFLIQPHATLLVLPSPVTCYQSSRYTQVQRFDLRCASTSSLVLLDWITPGREYLARGDERWAFDVYRSRNEVRVQGNHVVVRDVSLLERSDASSSSSSLAQRTHPYRVYANLFLLGPMARPLIVALQAEFHEIQQRVVKRTPAFIWSLSLLGDAGSVHPSAIVRIAGMETEQVRDWLKLRLRPLEAEVGEDLYKQTLW